jgi:hypothetical protein
MGIEALSASRLQVKLSVFSFDRGVGTSEVRLRILVFGSQHDGDDEYDSVACDCHCRGSK